MKNFDKRNHFDKRNKKLTYLIKLAFEPGLWFVLFMPVCTILLAQKPVASSWLTAQIFNRLQLAVEGTPDKALLYGAILYAVLIFGLDIAQWFLATASALIENHWRERVNEKLQKMFMQKDYKGNVADHDDPDLVSRRNAAKNVDPVGILKSVISFISTFMASVSFLVLLWGFSPIMVFVAVLIKLPTFYFYDKTMKMNRKFKIDSGTLNREKDYFYRIPVSKPNAKEYKIFSMKGYVCDKYDEVMSRYMPFYKSYFTKMAMNNSVLMHYDRIVTIAAEIVIGISVFTGKMLFGEYTLFVAAFNNLAKSVEQIVDFASQFKELQEQSGLLREYLESRNLYEDGEGCAREVGNVPHVIELEDVSFTYPGTDREVLHGLNMTLAAGKTYGLVGLNGSGKSTLVNLLLRLYEPDQGEIRLDGVNIREYNIRSYYKAIACVFQNTGKYAMPIKDYVASGRQCDLPRAMAALSQVRLTDWCCGLKHGLDTMLTREFGSEDDSVEPSIGQWQKLSIARAIYKDAPIMILDEPSASLDVDSENEIFHYIRSLADKKTAVLISHRLSNVVDCDHIFVLKEGRLAEEGSHQDLIRLGGVYSGLFESQAKYYKTSGTAG